MGTESKVSNPTYGLSLPYAKHLLGDWWQRNWGDGGQEEHKGLAALLGIACWAQQALPNHNGLILA